MLAASVMFLVFWTATAFALARTEERFWHARATRTDSPIEHALADWFIARYCQLVHRLEVTGRENAPQSASPGGVIVVCNHTAGVDPLLVTTALPFIPRWVMAEDMRVGLLHWFWVWQDVIFVDRAGGNMIGVKTAIRHVKAGQPLGIFPEGGLERPPNQIRPMLPGIALLITRTKAPVLPVIIDGAPQADPAWASLWRSSRSSVRIMPMINYAKDHPDLNAADIADDLRQRYLDWTGWPANDEDRGA